MSLPTSRRGFTLIEMLIVMAVMGIVGIGLTRALLSSQRLTRRQSQQAFLQSNLRAGMALMPTELREINVDASGSDIIAMAPDSIRYRAMRNFGLACAVTATTVTVRNAGSFGYRPITANQDSLLLFIENDDALMSDDAWVRYRVTAVANATCPDGAAATRLTVSGAANIPTANVLIQAPVRSFEVMTLKLYESGGRSWLGARVGTSGTLEPVLGPLHADSGVVMSYLTANGTATTVPANVRSIDIRMRGETQAAVSSGYEGLHIVEDSLTARIRLRNAP
jgi:prepilin-type N-terminal cleavage/methylation domain-containing protein